MANKKTITFQLTRGRRPVSYKIGLKGLMLPKTNEDGTRVTTDPYTSQDLMASTCKALDISLETTFTSASGRPMKIANSGKLIEGLV